MKTLKIAVFILLTAACINAQNAADIKKIDFTNYSHRIGKETVKFKNSLQINACAKDADGIPTGEIWNIEKDTIAYGDLDGDGKAEAIVPAIANVCGGNMITNEAVLIYTMKSGKPAKLPEFEYADEPCETGEECNFSRNPGVSVEYDAKEKAVVVVNYFRTEDDAICCPSFLRKTWYRWDGAKFVRHKKGEIEGSKPEQM